MAVKAMNDYVLVKPDPLENRTNSGLFLDTKDIAPTGTIVSAGTLCKNKLRPGDKVLFPKGMGAEKFKHNGEEHWIVKEDRVLLVLNDGENSGS